MRSSERRTPRSVGATASEPVDDKPLAPPPAPVLSPPWSLVAVTPEGEAVDTVHRWMNEPHVAKHWGQDWPLEEWEREVVAQLVADHCRPWLVRLDGVPVAYVEVYRAAVDVLGQSCEVEAGDLGVHIAIGVRHRIGQGLGTRVLRAVALGLFAADPECGRILGDPEADHIAARKAFAGAGFSLVSEVDLPHKRAAVMAFSRPEVGP